MVIPSKVNRLGKRYGFVRFSKVEDARVLGIMLDNIMIDGKKIHANVPRFERRQFFGEGGGIGTKGDHRVGRPFNQFQGRALEVRENISYANVVKTGPLVRKQPPLISFTSVEGEREQDCQKHL